MRPGLFSFLLVALVALPAACPAETVLVEEGSAMSFLANQTDPGLGSSWTIPGFDDASWTSGVFGVGYEAGVGAEDLLATRVAPGTRSVYTRTRFEVSDPALLENLFLGADWDDGWIAWLNGIEIHRSAEMPAGEPTWNTAASLHESSNGTGPSYAPMVDVSWALDLLVAGENVLAVGVWNADPLSSDLVLVPTLRADVEVRVTRGPYLQSATPTGITVRWRTNLETVGAVRYGPSPDALEEIAAETEPTTEHVVRLDGLPPETTFAYGVGTTEGLLEGGDADHWFRTSPPPGADRPLRAWIIGDSGTADVAAAAVRDAHRLLPGYARTDLWLMLGDNAYQDGTDDEYQRAVFDMYPELLRTRALWPTFGNHDALSASSGSQTGVYYALFDLPTDGEAGGMPSGTEAYYSFDWGDVHFVCLDSTGSDPRTDGPMATWLREDLAANARAWTVAFWHHPPYTKGSHDSDVEPSHILMRENILPILEDYGVDLVLGGHSHSYERSFLLDGHYGYSWDLTAAEILDGGDGAPAGDGPYRKATAGGAPHEGAVYLVAGSSGKTSGGPLDHPAMHVSWNVLGSVVLEAFGDRMDVRFLDHTATVRDAFSLVKGCAAEPCIETVCTDGSDGDGDGAADCEDPDCLHFSVDEDGDGRFDCDDCAPLDPGVHAAPGQPGTLRVARAELGVALAWQPAAAPGGDGTAYEVLTGELGELALDGGLASAACLSPASGTLTRLDERPGAPNALWYLVRSRNPCGATAAGERPTPDPCS